LLLPRNFNKRTFEQNSPYFDEPANIPTTGSAENNTGATETGDATATTATNNTSSAFNQCQILVPELVDVHPIPGIMWHLIVCLPSILHRYIFKYEFSVHIIKRFFGLKFRPKYAFYTLYLVFETLILILNNRV